MEYIPVLVTIGIICTLFIIGGACIDIQGRAAKRRKAKQQRQAERVRVRQQFRAEMTAYNRNGQMEWDNRSVINKGA